MSISVQKAIYSTKYMILDRWVQQQGIFFIIKLLTVPNKKGELHFAIHKFCAQHEYISLKALGNLRFNGSKMYDAIGILFLNSHMYFNVESSV